MTDVSGDLAAWVSAAGTISATVAALYIAQRGWREAGAERLHRDAAQAWQVISEQKGTTIEITNFSQAPILDVEIMNPFDEREKVYCMARMRDADSRGFQAILGPKECAIVDILSPDGQPADPEGSYKLTVRFMDVTGMDWGAMAMIRRDGSLRDGTLRALRPIPWRALRALNRHARFRYGPS